MQTFSLSPAFSRLKKQILALETGPDLGFPPEVAQGLHPLHEPNPVAPFTRLTPRQLWSQCFSRVRSLFLRASINALLGALATTGATLVAMEILKLPTRLASYLGLAAAYFVFSIANHYTSYRSSQYRSWIALATEGWLVSLVSRKLLELSQRSYLSQSSGNLKVLITSDAKNVGVFFDSFVRNFIPTVAAITVITPLLITFSGKGGLIGAAVLWLILPISYLLNFAFMHYQNRSNRELDRFTAQVGEWIKNARLIRSLSWDAAIRRELSEQLRAFMKDATILHLLACLLFGISMSWWVVAIASVLIASHVFDIPIDLVHFFGSLWLISFLASYLTHLPQTIRHFSSANPSIRRIVTFLNEEESREFFKPLPEGTQPLRSEPRALVLKNVTLEFDGRKTIDSLSLRIDLSLKTAVIGRIGAGKTLLSKLLLGEIPPTSGEIWIEDIDGNLHALWNQENYERFRTHLGYVPQEPYVSSDLLAHNISLTENPNEANALDAAYFAELEADLASFPQGMKTMLGEGGVNLSGGQRQRLNLARDAFHLGRYSILDDTLSAVDGKTERSLIDRLMRSERGMLLVTHRLKHLALFDEVILLQNGRLVVQARPGDLLKQEHPEYLELTRAYERDGKSEDLA